MHKQQSVIDSIKTLIKLLHKLYSEQFVLLWIVYATKSVT